MTFFVVLITQINLYLDLSSMIIYLLIISYLVKLVY